MKNLIYLIAVSFFPTILNIKPSFYENNVANLSDSIIYVDSSATGLENGSTWTDAFSNLTDALQTAEQGDTIWMAQGTYFPTSGDDRAATFNLIGGVALLGGFEGIESSSEERNPLLNPVVLSGDIGIPGDSFDNSYHILTVVDTDSSTTIDGITIRDGFNEDEFGCAILLKTEVADFANLNLKNCTIENNTGGAVLIELNSKIYFSYCNISNNINGGILDKGQGADFNGCRFENNINLVENGGAYIANGIQEEATFFNCIFYKNDALDRGLAINLLNDALRIDNCVFYGHHHPGSSSPNVHGVIYALGNDADLVINNSIFWSNSRNVIGKFSPDITINYCLLADQWQGYAGMILNQNIWNRIPVFNDPYNGDFTLSSCSPAVDSGILDSLTENHTTDYFGNSRIVGNGLDIGAIEKQSIKNCEIYVRDTVDSGVGSLRRAIDIANAHEGPDTVRFNIESGESPFIFTFEGAINLKDDSTVVDATTQPGWEPGSIQFDGTPFDYCYLQSNEGQFNIIICNYLNQGVSGDPGRSIKLQGDYCELYGIHFNGYSREAIRVTGDNARIGKPEKGNYFTFNSWESLSSTSVFEYQTLNFGDILIEGEHTLIQSNVFGQFPDGSYGGEWGGLKIFTPSDDPIGGRIMVGGNREAGEGNIFYNRNQAIKSNASLGVNSYFRGNDFLNFQNGLPLITNRSVFEIKNAEYENLIIEDNIFSNCGEIFFTSLDSIGRLEEITLTKNKFVCNTKIYGLGENNYVLDSIPAVDEEIYPNYVSGKSLPFDTIEIYLNKNIQCPENQIAQGEIYLGTTTTGQDSLWFLDNFLHPVQPGDWVTVLARDTAGNSSLFSPVVGVSCPLIINMDTILCDGAYFEYNGIVYDQTGIFSDTVLVYETCEVPALINIEVYPESLSGFNAFICEGETFEWNGLSYNNSGVFPQTFINQNGCDSTATLELTVLPASIANISETICEGDELVWNEETYMNPGIYNQYFVNQFGCDSLVVLELEMLPEQEILIDTAIVSGTAYNGILFTQDTILYETFVSENGCDSLVVTNISILTANDFDKLQSSIEILTFPNPFRFSTRFELNGGGSSTGTILLYNANGEKVHEKLFQESTFILERSDLPAGVYYFKLIIDETVVKPGKIVISD